MSAFYTFLSSLYNCLLKFTSLIILLGEVRTFLGEVLKISGEVQSYPKGGRVIPAHLPRKSGLDLHQVIGVFVQLRCCFRKIESHNDRLFVCFFQYLEL